MQIPFTVVETSLSQTYTLQNQSNESTQSCQKSIQGPSFKKAFYPLIEGFLNKKTLNRSWQQRYFVLNQYRLLYYTTAIKQQFKGCFTFASLLQYSVQLHEMKNELTLQLTVTFNTITQTLLQLQFPNAENYNAWMPPIRQCIERAKHTQGFPKVRAREIEERRSMGSVNFWNKLTISINEVYKYAGHLDLLLFQSRSLMASVTRFVSNAQYDHVAILIRDHHEQIYALHATQDQGVCLTPLNELLQNALPIYHQISYRKLIGKEHSDLPIAALEHYLNDIIGNEYDISLAGLFFGSLCFNQQALEHQRRTYFCSKLVADVYIQFGILPTGDASKWWPKDFQHTITLNSPYSLSQVMNIQLEALQNSQKTI